MNTGKVTAALPLNSNRILHPSNYRDFSQRVVTLLLHYNYKSVTLSPVHIPGDYSFRISFERGNRTSVTEIYEADALARKLHELGVERVILVKGVLTGSIRHLIRLADSPGTTLSRLRRSLPRNIKIESR
jgi:hypothetical protein